jgi:hypothetical protein
MARIASVNASSQEMPCLLDTRSALADRAVIGSMWHLADGEHGGDQVIQRPGQVVLSDQDNLVIDSKMVDRPTRNRVVGRRDSQGTFGQFLPWTDIARRGCVNHPAPHGAVLADSGHDDPHQLSLSPPTAFRQVEGNDRPAIP